MLTLHHADEIEPLLDALAVVLTPAPADAFTPDLVVVPTAGLADVAKVGLGRRLGAQEGQGDGVVANVEFVFPGRFQARALGLRPAGPVVDADTDPWSIGHLTWHVLEELQHGNIVVPGANTSNRWALARRVADLFDRYATQRPRLIQLWAQGEYTDGTYGTNGELTPLSPDHHWQVQLWQAVRTRIGVPGPAERLPGLLQDLRDGTLQPAVPQRVSLFGLGSIAPSQLTVLRALAEVRDVHLFLRHPSRAVWASEMGRLAGGLNLRAMLDITTAVKHPLVESWGRPALEAKVLVAGAADIREVGHVPESLPHPTTVLQALQRGIRLDLVPTLHPTLRADDGSLQVHACHGEVRQLEVLRDALGHAFVEDPTLQPHEVLVLCGDLERFAPLVEAVFSRGALPVPVRIGDRSLTTADPVGSALQAVLGLVDGRATLSEVLGLIQHEPVRRRFGWSIEHVEQFADWCTTLGTRWGLSTDHRLEWGLPQNITTGTWSAMVDRLMAGTAMPAPSPRLGLGDAAPHDDMGADEVHLAGTVADLLFRLSGLHAQVIRTQPIEQWAGVLHAAVDDFCAFDPNEPWRRQRVHRQIEQLLQSARSSADGSDTCDIPLSLAEVKSALNSVLEDSPGRLSLRSGAVTVSSFPPQHGVPARVVCLLGLDENALRSGVFDGDDVLGLHPCVGERHPRFESRQLLLDAVLSAGDRLIITCNGADLTTNKEVPLVVPMVEMLDVVGRLAPLQKNHAPVVVRHPRHGFNERALQPGALVSGSSRPFTFDTAMLHAAMARRSADAISSVPVSPWLLPPAIIESVDLHQLVEVVANPSKIYLRDRLDVRLPAEADELDDGLSLTVDPLTKSSIGRSLLDAVFAGHPTDQWMQAARLDGALPPGELNRVALNDIVTEVNELLELAAALGAPLGAGRRLDIDTTLFLGDRPGQQTLPLVGVVDGVELHSPHLTGTVGRVRFTKPRPSHRFGLAVQMAALQLRYPLVEWTGVLATRGEYASPFGCKLTLRRSPGALGSTSESASVLLKTVTTLLIWALRDAVPFFDYVSAKLAANDIGGADAAVKNDLRDRHVATLWPDLSIDLLRWQPRAVDDPQPMADLDDPPGARSRADLVARWLWSTYHSVIREEDADGNEILAATVEGAK